MKSSRIQSSMKTGLFAGLILVVALVMLVSAERGPATAQSASGVRTPVIVELYTSEGCSSCPPADALIARLARTQPVAGAEIIPLKLHVDYWNRLGWIDRFSSAAYSARQSQYADFFDNNGVYTPQMVVDGRTEFVGSAEAKALSAIAAAARGQKASVIIVFSDAARATASDPQNSSKLLSLTIILSGPLGRAQGEAADIFVAITEDDLHSNVTDGENAGRSFDHVAVVRTLRVVARLKPGQGPMPLSTLIPREPSWRLEHLHAVVFVQEEKSRRILAAASIPLGTSH